MGYILKFNSPNLYTIVIFTKIKKGFLKKKERVKDFFIFVATFFFCTFYFSFKQVESNRVRKRL